MGYPVLSDDFFKLKLASPEAFEKNKLAGPWSELCFPVSEWAGILYVAVADVSGIRVNGEWCLVQANPELMKSLYHSWTVAPVELQEMPLVPETEVSFDEDDSSPMDSSDDPGLLDLMTSDNSSFSSVTGAPVQLKKIEAPNPPAPAPSSSIQPSTPMPPAPEHEWMTLWQELRGPFQHGMILTSAHGEVTAWKWDNDLSCSGIPGTYSLQKASPFRICARTQKSYHGTISPSEVMAAFFKEWTSGKSPECLTISPVIQNEIVIGFLAAWGEGSAYTEAALKLVEEYAGKLGPILFQVLHGQAKSA